MTFSFDSGATGSEGPWIHWTAKGTEDRTIPPQSFYIRDRDKNKTPLDAFSKGVVFDLDSLKTGWTEDQGLDKGPKWTLGASPAQMPPKPSEDARKGFQVRCAISPTAAADWNQSGAGAFGALADLAPALVEGAAANPGKLPVVVMEDVKHVKFTVGSTIQPVLKVVKWVDRPAALKAQAMAFDTGEAPAAPAPAPAKPAPAVAADHAF